MKGKTGLPETKQRTSVRRYDDAERKNTSTLIPSGSIHSWAIEGLPDLGDLVEELESDHPEDQEDIATIKKILKGIMKYLCDKEFEWEDFEDMDSDDIAELIDE